MLEELRTLHHVLHHVRIIRVETEFGEWIETSECTVTKMRVELRQWVVGVLTSLHCGKSCGRGGRGGLGGGCIGTGDALDHVDGVRGLDFVRCEDIIIL